MLSIATVVAGMRADNNHAKAAPNHTICATASIDSRKDLIMVSLT